jgi:Tol biopolymer transport system component
MAILEAILRRVRQYPATMRVARALTSATALSLMVLAVSESSAMSSAGTGSIAITSRGAQGSVYTVNPDGTGLRRIASNGSAPLWSPERSRLVFTRRFPVGEDFRGDTIYRSDLYTVRADGSDVSVFQRGAVYPTWSPDGRTVAFIRGNFALWTAHLDGSAARRIVKSQVEDATWSPDGAWIAFTWYAKAHVEIWLVHPDGTGLRRLVRGKSPEGDSPAWSPDGKRVSFMGGFDNDNLYVVEVDGTRLRTVTTASDTNEWSPTGRHIMFERGYLEREPNALWLTTPDGRSEARLGLRTTDPDWSPTGRQIAFIRRNKIYVMNADGTTVRLVTAGGPAAGGLDW